MTRLLVAVIRFYQRWLSPLLPPACRYTPSCSEYAVEAIRRFGAIRGTWMGMRRILRCHPFCHGGYDPVPPRRDSALPEGDPPAHRCLPTTGGGTGQG